MIVVQMPAQVFRFLIGLVLVVAVVLVVSAVLVTYKAHRIAMRLEALQQDKPEAAVEKQLPTTEQLLQLEIARKLERIDAKIASLPSLPRAVTPASRLRMSVRRNASVNEPVISKRPATGVWSAEAERSRDAWRAWAASELKRLRENNRETAAP